MHVKSVESLELKRPPVGVVVRRGEMPAQPSGQGRGLVAGASELEPDPLKTRRVEELLHVKCVDTQTPFRWCGVEVRKRSSNSGAVLVT
ncbi:hypothetical protein TNCV_4192331 [Trichonephila clavipes]|nr:hypothetical protein TNCV_4192331 [Trichonephila clavipes]